MFRGTNFHQQQLPITINSVNNPPPLEKPMTVKRPVRMTVSFIHFESYKGVYICKISNDPASGIYTCLVYSPTGEEILSDLPNFMDLNRLVFQVRDAVQKHSEDCRNRELSSFVANTWPTLSLPAAELSSLCDYIESRLVTIEKNPGPQVRLPSSYVVGTEPSEHLNPNENVTITSCKRGNYVINLSDFIKAQSLESVEFINDLILMSGNYPQSMIDNDRKVKIRLSWLNEQYDEVYYTNLMETLTEEQEEYVMNKISDYYILYNCSLTGQTLGSLESLIASKLITIEKNPGPKSAPPPVTVIKKLKDGKKEIKRGEKEVRVANKVIKQRSDYKPQVSLGIKRGSNGLKPARRKDAEIIAMAVTLPGESPSIRWGSQFGSDPTALASPKRRVAAIFGGNGVTPAYFRADEAIAFAFKSLQRSLVYYDSNNAALTYTGSAYGISETTTKNGLRISTPPTSVWSVTTSGVEPVDLVVPFMQYGSTYKPHGPVQYAGTDAEREKRYLWYDDGNVTFAINAGGPANCLMTFNTVSWSPQGVVLSASGFTTTASGSGSVTVPISAGYKAFTISISDTAYIASSVSFNVYLNFTSSGGCSLCHLPVDGYVQKVGAIDAARVYANSLMYTNDASFNSRQGKIVAYQMPAGNSFLNLITGSSKSVFDVLASYGNGTDENVMTADNGFRVWQKFTSPEDFNMVDTTTTVDGVLYDSFYPLVSALDYLIVAANVTNPLGQDGYFTHRCSVEFKTRDNWFDKEVTNYTTAQMDDAIAILNHVPQFTTNETHLSKIWNSIKSGGKAVVNGVIEYGPQILKVAKLLATFI